MHFNVYIDDQAGKQLNAAAKKMGKTRNALIREAIQSWITRRAQPQWPEAIIKFQGIANMPRFESYRDQLRDPSEDPLL